MYVSSWPGLTLWDLAKPRAARQRPYPLDRDNRLSFCVARSGIYHLFRALNLSSEDRVLVPDYHSGNEISAMRATGANLEFYPIRRNLDPDLDVLGRLMKERPRVVYVIHYLGWPQPMREIEALCRESGSILIEDCALSLLSEADGRPLGTFGDYSIFCLYKTLPVPNGGVLVQNNNALADLKSVRVQPCPKLTGAGRTMELALESVRSRFDGFGRALFGLKRKVGELLRASDVRQVPIGNIGWDIGDVNVGMSPISGKVMDGLEYAGIREKRRINFLQLRSLLEGRVKMLRADLPEGVCPLFFPILVRDKHAVASALWDRGIGAVEFWNAGGVGTMEDCGPDAAYLRRHVLELPIHQGVSTAHVEYIAQQVRQINPEPAP